MLTWKKDQSFFVPTEAAVLEEIINGNVDGDSAHKSSEVISEGDIVVDEEDVELTTIEVLEDVEVINYDFEFDLNEQL